jgi:mRNA interferase MazF
VTCEPGTVVVVPFPFVERPESRRRPALVLSTRTFNKEGHTMLAMITTSSHAPWPGDVAISKQAAAGLKADCRVRLKLFTLDNRLIVRRIGRLAGGDLQAVSASLGKHLMSARAGGQPPRLRHRQGRRVA